MRFLTCVIVAVTVLVGAFFGYCFYGAQVQLESVGTVKTPANEMMDSFSAVREQLSLDAFYGEQFRETEFEAPENYAFITLNVRMKNVGLFPMEWMRVEVEPNAADILQLAPQGDAPTLERMSLGEYAVTVLTLADAETRHTLTVSYYVLGRKHEKEFVM